MLAAFVVNDVLVGSAEEGEGVVAVSVQPMPVIFLHHHTTRIIRYVDVPEDGTGRWVRVNHLEVPGLFGSLQCCHPKNVLVRVALG